MPVSYRERKAAAFSTALAAAMRRLGVTSLSLGPEEIDAADGVVDIDAIRDGDGALVSLAVRFTPDAEFSDATDGLLVRGDDVVPVSIATTERNDR